MTIARQLKTVINPAAFALAGWLIGAIALRAADAPADAAAAPPPPPPPAPSTGTWYIFSPPKDGEVLMTPMREKLLTAVKSINDRSNAEQFNKVKNSPNPFYPKMAPPVEATAPAAGTAPSTAAPTATPQITPEDKLQQVADQLKPSGALIVGPNNRLISIASGDTLALGQSIQVTFPGDSGPTGVILQAVTADNFTLKLGDTTKTFPYYAKENVPHPLSSPTPSQPKKP